MERRKRNLCFCRSEISLEDARGQAERVVATRDDIEDVTYKEGGNEGNWFCSVSYYVKHED